MHVIWSQMVSTQALWFPWHPGTQQSGILVWSSSWPTEEKTVHLIYFTFDFYLIRLTTTALTRLTEELTRLTTILLLAFVVIFQLRAAAALPKLFERNNPIERHLPQSNLLQDKCPKTFAQLRQMPQRKWTFAPKTNAQKYDDGGFNSGV